MIEKKKKIILFNPPLFYSEGKPYVLDVSVPPLGLLYLATYINQKSNDWLASVVDIGPENQKLKKTIELLKEKNPDIVGITAMTPQLQGTLELAKKIKENFPDIKIVLGGPHISGDPDFINRFDNYFDFGITGEGEMVLLDLLIKIKKGDNISGIYTGKTIHNLDELPLLDKTLIKREKYAPHESIMASRGCPFNCYYCSRPAIDRLTRFRSADSIISEIESTYKYSKGLIHFQDDTITMKKDKIIDFCKEVINRKLEIKWHCNTRIDMIDEELIEIMAKAGCELIHFGIESANEKIRREIINKPFKNSDILEKFVLCKKYNIKVACYFMLGHPTETKETLEETKNFILNNKIDIVGISIPTPFPGSKLYEIAEDEGIINKGLIDSFANKKLGEGYAGNYPIYIPKELNKEELLNLRKSILRKFYLRPSFIFKRMKESITSWQILKRDIIDAINLILKGSSKRQPYKEKEIKKIVIISPFFSPNIGGLETHLNYLTDYLNKEKIYTTVLTYKPLTTKVVKWLKVEKNGFIEIKRCWWFGHNWFEKLVNVPLLEFIYIVPGLLLFSLYHSFKNRKKVHCFHAHGLAAGFIVRIISLFIKRHKILSTHYIYNLNKRPLFSKVLKWVFKSYDIIFAVGEESKKELIDIGLPKDKIKIFKQWIDNNNLFVYNRDNISVRKKICLPSDKTIILFVGRLLPMKGVKYLIEAAGQDKSLLFIFIGSGCLENDLVKASQLYSNIIYLGKKNGIELVDYYNAVDMVVLPSTEEGSSLVVVEALSCGRPVIITNRGCSKDMFPDELGEKIIPNTENILQAIYKLRERLKKDNQLRQKCRDFAYTNYSAKNGKLFLDNYFKD